MEYLLIQAKNVATASQPSEGLMSSLGIDWAMLGFQTLAFLILLLILKKFVYPPLVKMLDKRDEVVRASADAAMEAEKSASEAEVRTAELLDQAKREASEIIATAKEEATVVAKSIQDKAEAKSESLLASAKEEIDKEVMGAKVALKTEAIELVAMATGKVIEQKIDAKQDAGLIKRALEEIK